MEQITLCEGGTGEKEIAVKEIQIPDLWHIASWLKNKGMEREAEMVLEVWGLAHDMKKALLEKSL